MIKIKGCLLALLVLTWSSYSFADFNIQVGLGGTADLPIHASSGADVNLWSEMRRHFRLPQFPYDPKIAAQLYWYKKHHLYFETIAGNATPYLYYIYRQARKRHLPMEVALLPMIESNYNPFAYSAVGAGGMWQLMPATASYFGLHRDYWHDDRRDVLQSTTVALNYLQYLGNFFNHDWLLAIAAYNSGEGTVLNAINANRKRGRKNRFLVAGFTGTNAGILAKIISDNRDYQ